MNFALTYWKPKAVKQTGPLSCTISMTDPWVAFPAWLAGYIGGQVAYVFSPTQFQKSEALLNTHPVGTGPVPVREVGGQQLHRQFTRTRTTGARTPSGGSSPTSTHGPSSRCRT